MTAIIGWSRHVTGWTTLRLVGGRILDLDQIFSKISYQTENSLFKLEIRNMYIQTGVPQGSIWGQPLSIIYINYIISACSYFKIIIYADDTTLSVNVTADLNDIDQLTLNINSEIKYISIMDKVVKLTPDVTKSRFMVLKRLYASKSVYGFSIHHMLPIEINIP